VAGNLQKDFEYFFLSALYHEGKLIDDDCNGTALEHCWWIFLHDLLKAFYASF
jgi:hypothetical protein